MKSGITHLASLCVYYEKYSYRGSANTDDFVKGVHEYLDDAGVTVDEIWLKLGSVERSDIYDGLDFSISNIPQTIRLTPEQLFGEDRVCRLSDISYENDVLSVAPDAEIRSTRDFQNIGLMYFTWPGRDDVHQLLTHALRRSGTSYAPDIYAFTSRWTQRPPIKINPRSLLALNLDREREFEVNAHRNTAPLIMHELCTLKKVRAMRGVMIDAQDVQALYGVEADGSVSPRKHLSHALLVEHELVTESGALTDFGRSLLSAMHPSSRDPKFAARKAEWLGSWDESRDKAERWVKTWSGRLRRLQAKKWKRNETLDEKVNELMRAYEGMRTTTVSPVVYAALVASRHFQEAGVREYDLCRVIHEKAMRSRDVNALSLKSERTAISDVLGEHPPVEGSYFWNEEVKDLRPLGQADQERVLAAFPDLWATGIKAALGVLENGGCTMYSVIDVPMPEMGGATEFLPELDTPPGPHWPKTDDVLGTDPETTTYPLALYVIPRADEMDPAEKAAHLAFRRGASAVWHALMITDGLRYKGLDRAKAMAIGAVRFDEKVC